MSKEKNYDQPIAEPNPLDSNDENSIGEETGNTQPEDNTKEESSEDSEPQNSSSIPSDDKTAKLEKEILEYRDKLIRKIAEFENYKKRTAEEYTRLINTAGENIIVKILPVIDDLERMQKNTKTSTSVEDLNKGVDLIMNKFQTILNNCGLKEIPAVKEEFNPDLHEALMQMESPDFSPNQIIDQHEKGYTLNGKVIRHSKVLVAK
jgi:molecular chaperone GrpE